MHRLWMVELTHFVNKRRQTQRNANQEEAHEQQQQGGDDDDDPRSARHLTADFLVAQTVTGFDGDFLADGHAGGYGHHLRQTGTLRANGRR